MELLNTIVNIECKSSIIDIELRMYELKAVLELVKRRPLNAFNLLILLLQYRCLLITGLTAPSAQYRYI